MVIISSFYNEEYLLPWWLKHHGEIFEHGILFDYFSTDRSVGIINRLCPTWEVRKTRNKNYDFANNDAEFMEAEREVKDYKIVLTTTEFLVGHIPQLSSEPTAYRIPFIRMVDNKPWKKPDAFVPLVEQKNFGYIDRSKHRFLHNYPDGQYGVGRHKTNLKTKNIGAWIFKYVFSPWNEKFIKRRLQIKTQMSPRDKPSGRGWHHTWDRNRLEKEYQKALARKDVWDYSEKI